MWQMSQFSLQMGMAPVIISGLLQGLLAEGRRGARRRPRRIGEFEDLRNRVGCTGLDRRNWQI
jgi:hypothetical protein